MQITNIEKHAGSGMWHGSANDGDKNYLWYYRPRSSFRMQEQDEINPRCWMNVDPPEGAKRAVLKAVRGARP
jgi:hypothetical protein